jgi:hypothetical protein
VGTGLFDRYSEPVERDILSWAQSLHFAIDLKPQDRETFVAVSNGMIFYDVAEVRDGPFFRGREANNTEVAGVDCFYDSVESSPLFVVQRKLYFSPSKKPIVRLAQECGYRVHVSFFRPGRVSGEMARSARLDRSEICDVGTRRLAAVAEAQLPDDLPVCFCDLLRPFGLHILQSDLPLGDGQLRKRSHHKKLASPKISLNRGREKVAMNLATLGGRGSRHTTKPIRSNSKSAAG